MMSLITGIATRFAVMYSFKIGWWVVGKGLNATNKLREKAETIDYEKVQKFLDRQKKGR